MFSTDLNRILSAHLAKVLPDKAVIDDLTLLRAYVTFLIQKAGGEDTEFSLSFLDNNDELLEVAKIFLSIDVLDFFRYATPSMVADIDRFTLFCNETTNESPLSKLPVDLIINLLLVKKNKKVFFTTIASEKKYPDAIREYQSLMSTSGLEGVVQIPSDCLRAFIESIFFIPLDSVEKRIKYYNSSPKAIGPQKIAEILKDDLRLSREEQLKACSLFYEKDKEPFQSRLQDLISNSPFSMNSSNACNDLSTGLLMVPPLDVLCALYIGKKRKVYDRADGNEKYALRDETYNDLLLENSIVFNLFSSSIFPKLNEDSQYIVFFPSPFFIRKWHEMKRLVGCKVTFVMKEESSVMLLNKHFSDPNRCVIKRTDVDFFFTDYRSWLNQNDCPHYDKVLIISTETPKTWQSESRNKLCSLDGKPEFFVLSSDSDLSDTASMPYFFLNNSEYAVEDMLLFSKGIEGSIPRMKNFWKARFGGDQTKTEYLNTIHIRRNTHKSRNMNLEREARCDYLLFDDSDSKHTNLHLFYDSKVSLRQFLFKEENPKDKAKQRSVHHFDFTPEIRFWYSQSTNKKKPWLVRLVTYVCEPVSEEKIQAGGRPRGKRILESAKVNMEVAQDSVESYLNEQYPYQQVFQRQGNGEKRSIRSVIGEAFQKVLEKQRICLKSLVYIYPELDGKYLQSDYAILREISYSCLGSQSLESLTEDDFYSFLELNYHDNAIRCLSILSVALDFAKEREHCSENVLEKALSNSSKSDRAFASLRSALTKKTLTEGEMDRFLDLLLKRIQRSPKWLGVLVKLLTGLESNIVCGLRWMDFVKVESYGFYQLHVYSQLSNDGKTAKGFDSDDDYRCIPCSEILATAIVDRKIRLEMFGIVAKDEFIVKESDSPRELKRPLAPRELDVLTKDLISMLGIPDVAVSIPDLDGGFKDTNLSKYQGDLLRENFRYWALTKAKLLDDEIQYLLGNRRSTTFGIFYCDYLCDASQYLLYSKLRRMDAILLYPSEDLFLKKDYEITDSDSHEYRCESKYPIQLDMSVIPADSEAVKITITATHGLIVAKEGCKR